MRDVSLWRGLLGIEKVVIEGVEFDPVVGRLVVSVRPVARSAGRCGRCLRRCPGYDRGRGRRRWRALDLGVVQAWVEADAPRVRCRVHGVVVGHVPWARHDAGHTRWFDDQVAWLTTKTSKLAVTELMRVAWRSVGAIIARVWSEIEGRIDLLAGLRRIGIDEVSYRRGHLFLTVVVDHDTGRLVWAAAGQNKATLQRFFDALGTEEGGRCSQITHVSADSAAYIANRVKVNCPDAIRAADPFHVVKWANDALGEVRHDAWREARQAARRAAAANPVRRGRPPQDAPSRPDQAEQDRVRKLSRSRYALWKNPENLTPAQRVKLDWIAATDPRLYRGYQLKEGLRAILQLPLDQATDALDRWIASARRCRIPQFVALQRTITAQRGPILAAIEHGLSNARTESTNTKIRLRTRMAFGFKNPDALIALLMLSLGGHQPRLPGRT